MILLCLMKKNNLFNQMLLFFSSSTKIWINICEPLYFQNLIVICLYYVTDVWKNRVLQSPIHYNYEKENDYGT